VRKPPSFSTFFNKLVCKKCGNYTVHFMLGGRFGVSQTGAETACAVFGGFFHQIKERKYSNRKTDYYTTRSAREVEGLEAIFVSSGS
jgi:hypothetical protein